MAGDRDVIVVGAGLAGLYAAHVLQKSHGKNVVVLEAKELVGGRTCTTSLRGANGTDTWDLGGQWAGRTQHHLMAALKEFGLETYDQFVTGRKKLMLHDPSNITSYSGLIPHLGPLVLLEINSVMEKIESMLKTIDLNDITNHPNAMEWDSVTMHGFVNNICKYQETREIFETAVRTIFGVDLSQMSLLFFLYYSKQADGFDRLIDAGKGGAQEYRVKGSMGQLCEIIADQIKHENIHCGDPVSSIREVDGTHVEVTTMKGRVFRGNHIIVAIPPHLVNHINFTPPLPYDRVRLGEQMPVGHLIKFIATYSTAFWREKGFSGESTVTNLPCSIGPITVTFDGTTSSGSPALIGFICAEQAIYWSRRSMLERREAVLQSMAALLGEECLDPIEYIDKDWAQEPYNGGCPVGVMHPRGLLYFHHALKRPFGRIHWAGTETARVWCGYLDGAIESAKRAVSEVVEQGPVINKVWKESPAFSKYKSFVSHYDRSEGSRVWNILKISASIGLCGLMAYFLVKRIKQQ